MHGVCLFALERVRPLRMPARRIPGSDKTYSAELLSAGKPAAVVEARERLVQRVTVERPAQSGGDAEGAYVAVEALAMAEGRELATQHTAIVSAGHLVAAVLCLLEGTEHLGVNLVVAVRGTHDHRAWWTNRRR